ncbi:type VI secretion system (T6SS) VipA/Hcp2 family protein [Chitinophaga dinghuensis]|uniref:Type VI secretion system (T6SS) VipA/Hcp2 family protein n=1 Tax=Chitinophaga dinghuensis TaxID=1539050 RepID=A0A327WFF8_9BACT|nr:type VI secretion system contractile sheath small subunit [Chitinophaga dinghuensis]RAJ88090.1 type VI secretion system (T6SS) VipA/Hcp2 family protein [Chitinophaga dinghuensis]
MFNYEIGGNERRIDTSEAFVDISPNKTLFVQQLTEQEPIKPEIVEGLKTVEEVFKHFKPKVSVDFEQKDGSTVNETLHFDHLGDFSVKSMIQQSNQLRDLNVESEMYLNIIRQLKTNKTLKATLENPETRQAFAAALENLAKELQQNI